MGPTIRRGFCKKRGGKSVTKGVRIEDSGALGKRRLGGVVYWRAEPINVHIYTIQNIAGQVAIFGEKFFFPAFFRWQEGSVWQGGLGSSRDDL